MEKSFLKMFFFGTEEEIEAFIAPLKARCLQPTDQILKNEDGTPRERLIYNSEDESYISQSMVKYKVCPHCGQLEKADDIVTVDITRGQWRRPSGSRYFKRTETLCKKCLGRGDFLALDETDPNRTEDEYLYVDNSSSIRVIKADGRVVWKTGCYGDLPVYEVVEDGDTAEGYRISVRQREFVEDGASLPDGYAFVCATNGYGGVRKSVVACDPGNYPTLFARCEHCGKWWGKDAIHDGKCPDCSDIRIYGYHNWPGEREFKHAEGEEVDRNTLYFGTEVECVGSEDNRFYTAQCKDFIHLEHDGSLGYGGFEMISQPMTMQYVLSVKDRIAAMFKDLSEHGQKSHEASSCGFHIHVSRKAFKDNDAILKAVAIVNGMEGSMSRFARRVNCSYARYAYGFNGHDFSKRDVQNIDTCGHHVAVNTENSSRDKNTIEFRIFRGTLNINTYLAAIQFVGNIVKMANSDRIVVRFNDLLEGEYIEKYCEEQQQYRGDLSSTEFVNFSRFVLGEKIEAYTTALSRETFVDLVQSLASVGDFSNVSITFPEEAEVEGGAA